MKWVEITIVTTEEASEAVSEMLSQLGADGIAVSDPFEIARIIEDPASLTYADEGFIESLGTDVTVKAYFAEEDDGIHLVPKNEDGDNFAIATGNAVNKILPLDETLSLISSKLQEMSQYLPVGEGLKEHRYVEDVDWANEWKKDYTSFRISDRVIICPSWEEAQTKEDDIVVKLDPGSAFGTGTHETTSMCAKILDGMVTSEDKILDLGTGSGILSIICDKLGAGKIEAIDIDPLAVDVARENCIINGCEDIDCYAGELKDAKASDYSIVVANIIADIIAAIASDVPSKLKEGGRFVCSGIINTKKEKVEQALKDAGFTILEKHEKNDWMAYVCALT
ncbi:MAG: 50S ribosomal protein L11 methyltransferase [Saccharofermentans sp.]|nr:50S ribosomal protein L11 methyltransferase [Saccharofermentans sp.]